MSFVNINNVRMEGVERAERLLTGISGGADNAIKSAADTAATYMRSVSVKTIQERYAISAKNIRENELVRVNYSFWDGLSVTIRFAGRKIPLYRFNGTTPKQPVVDTSKKKVHIKIDGNWVSVYPSLPVKAHALKSTSPKRLYNSFTARMSNGHVGIFEREDNKKRFPIEEKKNSSVPEMLNNPIVKERLTKETAAKFEEILEQKILDILNGRW